MKGRNCYMQSIRNILAVKNSARDITLGENCRFVGQFNLLKTLDEFQICRAMRFRNSLKLANYERRDHCSISRTAASNLSRTKPPSVSFGKRAVFTSSATPAAP